MEGDFQEFVLDVIGGIIDELRDNGVFISNEEAVDLVGEAYNEIEQEFERREKGDVLIGKTEEQQHQIKLELLVKLRREELVQAHDGDVAFEEVEGKWIEKIDSEGDDIVKLDAYDRIEQIERGVIYVPVEIEIRRVITLDDGLLSLKLAQLLQELKEIETTYGEASITINRYWRQK